MNSVTGSNTNLFKTIPVFLLHNFLMPFPKKREVGKASVYLRCPMSYSPTPSFRIPSSLVPIYRNHIMFAYDLYHSQIEYLREFFKFLKDLSKKWRSEATSTNIQFSIVTSGFAGLGLPSNRLKTYTESVRRSKSVTGPKVCA